MYHISTTPDMCLLVSRETRLDLAVAGISRGMCQQPQSTQLVVGTAFIIVSVPIVLNLIGLVPVIRALILLSAIHVFVFGSSISDSALPALVVVAGPKAASGATRLATGELADHRAGTATLRPIKHSAHGIVV